MKVRVGFVSNSSSSSYVVIIPASAEAKLYAGENANLANRLMNDGELWQEQVDWDKFEALAEELKPYIVATIDGGPDDGKIVLADQAKARKILNEN